RGSGAVVVTRSPGGSRARAAAARRPPLDPADRERVAGDGRDAQVRAEHLRERPPPSGQPAYASLQSATWSTTALRHASCSRSGASGATPGAARRGRRVAVIGWTSAIT